MKKKIFRLTILSLLLIPTKIFAGYYNLTEFKSQETNITSSLMQYTDMGQPVENTGVFYLTGDYSNADGTKSFSMKVQGNELDTTKNYILTFISSTTSSAQEHSYSGTELNEGITVTLPEENIPTNGKVTVTLREENTTNLIDHTVSICAYAADPATCESTETITYNTIILFFSYPNTNPNPGNGSGPTMDEEEVARMQALIESIAPDGILELDTVDPKKTNAREELYDSLTTAAFVKKYDVGKYEAFVSPKSQYVENDNIQLYYMDYVNNKYASYTQNIQIKYKEKDTTINSKIEEIRNKLNKTSQYYREEYNNNFNITDLESLNYYFNTQNTNNQIAANYLLPSYSSKIHELTDNLAFDFMFDPRAGGGESLFYEPIIGPINILYNGTVVDNIDPIGFTLSNILYIPSDTPKTREAFISAAQKRIDEYFKGQNIRVVYQDDIENLTEEQYSWGVWNEQTHTYSYTPLFDLEKTNGEFYGIEINDAIYSYFIVADSEKMNTPRVKTVDMNTNIKIESDSYDVPLDSRINVRKLDKNSDEFKLLAQKIQILDDMSFDIDLLSSSLDMKIETLANGTFKVYIPVDEATTKKTLVAAYVKEDGTVEEHNITFEGNYAVFETNHFSTYSIVDKSNNPETGDKILKYGTILGVCVLGLAGIKIYTKKTKKN